jgi:hypothetical protein
VLAQRWGNLDTVSLLTRTKVRTGSIRPRASAALVLPLNPSVVWPNDCLYWAACPALSGMDTVRRLVCTYRLTAPQPGRAADPYDLGGAFLCFGAAHRPLAMLHKRGAHVALMLEEGLGYSALSVKAVSLTGEGERLRRSPVSSVESNIGVKLSTCQATLGYLVPVRTTLSAPVIDV